LQLTTEELAAYLDGLQLGGELEKLRAERSRLELGRKRLSERLTQVLTRAPYLDDLGILKVIDDEVLAQLNALLEQARGRDDAEDWLRTELSLEPSPFGKLLRRYGLAVAA